MTRDELNVIVEKHRKWISGERGGECAHLYGADLVGSDMRDANLSEANFRGCILDNVNLCRANLTRVGLCGAYLNNANLTDAKLKSADLRSAKLTNAILIDADLRGAYLSEANLSGANLSGANLYGTCLVRADLSGAIGLPPIACPEVGSFIGYKAALTVVDGDQIRCIVKLRITEDSKRSSATTRKCRCSKAEVMSITTVDGEELGVAAYSYKHPCFIYGVGNTVEVSDFDENRWNECSTGIHFFLSRSDAVNWNMF